MSLLQTHTMQERLPRIVLGLDIGVASIGWSLVRLWEESFDDELAEAERKKYKIADFEILDLGVRTFAKSEDRQGNSLACARGAARRIRRTLSRRKARRQAVRCLLEEYGLVEKTPAKKVFDTLLFGGGLQNTPWMLRVKALDHLLTKDELARVIYHIIGHRGFYFTAKSEEKENDGAVVKKSMKALQERMGSARTIGESLLHQAGGIITQAGTLGVVYSSLSMIRNRSGKNKEYAYKNCIDRRLLQKELALILSTQRDMGHTALDDAFMERAGNLLMRQKGYDAAAVEKMWGKCPIFTDEKRAPACTATAEYYALLNRVNNLHLVKGGGKGDPLTGEQRAKVIEKLYSAKGELKFDKLRKLLGKEAEGCLFNLCDYTARKDGVSLTPEACEKKTLVVSGLKGVAGFASAFGQRFAEVYTNRLFLDAVAHALAKEKEDDKRLKGIAKACEDFSIPLNEKETDALLSLSYKGTAAYSMKALRILVQYMEPTGEYGGRKQYDALQEAIRNGDFPDFRAMNAEERQAYIPPYEGDFLRNPVVCRVFAQTRKLINAIQRKHGRCIDAVHIEVGTEIANGQKKRVAIVAGQRVYKDAKDRAVDKLRECGMAINSANILKMRLFAEQDERCVYTGKKISLERGAGSVYFDDCEVDHILPFSRTFNDSMNNKVIVCPAANQAKGNRIPREWLAQPQEWDAFEQRVSELMRRLPWNKKRTLLRKELTDKDREEFMSRNLNDMRYASRSVADYLRRYFMFSDARTDINPLSRVQVVSGGITHMLRYAWGMDAKNEVKADENGEVLPTLYKDRGANDKHHALDATVVACTTRGHVFCLANLSQKYNRQVRHTFNDIFQKQYRLKRELAEKMEFMNVSRMQRHTVTASAHDDTIISPYKIDDSTKGRRVRLNDGDGYAAMGEIVRADIFKDAKGKRYIVPLYTQDFLGDTLPCKAIVNNAPYAEWIDVSDPTQFRFCFSLFKDDLVRVDGQFYYISSVRGTRASVRLLRFDMPSGGEYVEKSINQSTWHKYAIDILGNITRIRKETRIGTKKELHAQRMAKKRNGLPQRASRTSQ